MGQGTAHARLREGLMGGSGHGNVSSSAPETGLASVFRLMGPLRGAAAAGVASTGLGAGLGAWLVSAFFVGAHEGASRVGTGLTSVLRFRGPRRGAAPSGFSGTR